MSFEENGNIVMGGTESETTNSLLQKKTSSGLKMIPRQNSGINAILDCDISGTVDPLSERNSYEHLSSGQIRSSYEQQQSNKRNASPVQHNHTPLRLTKIFQQTINNNNYGGNSNSILNRAFFESVEEQVRSLNQTTTTEKVQTASLVNKPPIPPKAVPLIIAQPQHTRSEPLREDAAIVQPKVISPQISGDFTNTFQENKSSGIIRLSKSNETSLNLKETANLNINFTVQLGQLDGRGVADVDLREVGQNRTVVIDARKSAPRIDTSMQTDVASVKEFPKIQSVTCSGMQTEVDPQVQKPSYERTSFSDQEQSLSLKKPQTTPTKTLRVANSVLSTELFNFDIESERTTTVNCIEYRKSASSINDTTDTMGFETDFEIRSVDTSIFGVEPVKRSPEEHSFHKQREISFSTPEKEFIVASDDNTSTIRSKIEEQASLSTSSASEDVSNNNFVQSNSPELEKLMKEWEPSILASEEGPKIVSIIDNANQTEFIKLDSENQTDLSAKDNITVLENVVEPSSNNPEMGVNNNNANNGLVSCLGKVMGATGDSIKTAVSLISNVIPVDHMPIGEEEMAATENNLPVKLMRALGVSKDLSHNIYQEACGEIEVIQDLGSGTYETLENLVKWVFGDERRGEDLKKKGRMLCSVYTEVDTYSDVWDKVEDEVEELTQSGIETTKLLGESIVDIVKSTTSLVSSSIANVVLSETEESVCEKNASQQELKEETQTEQSVTSLPSEVADIKNSLPETITNDDSCILIPDSDVLEDPAVAVSEKSADALCTKPEVSSSKTSSTSSEKKINHIRESASYIVSSPTKLLQSQNPQEEVKVDLFGIGSSFQSIPKVDNVPTKLSHPYQRFSLNANLTFSPPSISTVQKHAYKVNPNKFREQIKHAHANLRATSRISLFSDNLVADEDLETVSKNSIQISEVNKKEEAADTFVNETENFQQAEKIMLQQVKDENNNFFEMHSEEPPLKAVVARRTSEVSPLPDFNNYFQTRTMVNNGKVLEHSEKKEQFVDNSFVLPTLPSFPDLSPTYPRVPYNSEVIFDRAKHEDRVILNLVKLEKKVQNLHDNPELQNRGLGLPALPPSKIPIPQQRQRRANSSESSSIPRSFTAPEKTIVDHSKKETNNGSNSTVSLYHSTKNSDSQRSLTHSNPLPDKKSGEHPAIGLLNKVLSSPSPSMYKNLDDGDQTSNSARSGSNRSFFKETVSSRNKQKPRTKPSITSEALTDFSKSRISYFSGNTSKHTWLNETFSNSSLDSNGNVVIDARKNIVVKPRPATSSGTDSKASYQQFYEENKKKNLAALNKSSKPRFRY